MATIENRSKYQVTVKNRPDPDPQIPVQQVGDGATNETRFRRQRQVGAARKARQLFRRTAGYVFC
jgi:hypothetical protein